MDGWKTTAVIAAAVVMIVLIGAYTDMVKKASCYEAAAKGAVVECDQ